MRQLTQAWIAEAEAFGGDPFRALDIASQTLRSNDRLRPLLTRMGGVALARLGQREAATRELRHSLRTARERRCGLRHCRHDRRTWPLSTRSMTTSSVSATSSRKD